MNGEGRGVGNAGVSPAGRAVRRNRRRLVGTARRAVRGSFGERALPGKGENAQRSNLKKQLIPIPMLREYDERIWSAAAGGIPRDAAFFKHECGNRVPLPARSAALVTALHAV